MARKIRRNTKLYKKSKLNRKGLNTFIFIILLAALIGGGFMISMALSARVSKKDNPSSDAVSGDVGQKTSSTPVNNSSDSVTSEQIDIEMTGENISIFMPYTLYEGNNQVAIKQWLDKAKTDGYNTVAVELKDEAGIIHYKSTNLMAIEYEAVSKSAIELEPLVSAIKNAGLIPTASISALKDKTAPSIARENSYAYGDNTAVNWWDNSAANGGKPWLNPYMENTRKYIADLSKEVSDAGFSQIVLYNVIFPDKNTQKMNVITESMSRENIIKKVLTDAQEKCKVPVVHGYNVTASETTKQDMLKTISIYNVNMPYIRATELSVVKSILAELKIDDYIVY